MANILGSIIHGHGREAMFKYEKKLPYPVEIKKKDLKMAKAILTQLGGANCRRYNLKGIISNEMQVHETENKQRSMLYIL